MVTPIKKHVAQDIAKHARDDINIMADKATQIAEDRLKPLLDEARSIVQHEQNAEVERLVALAQVNPNIRQEEIAYRRKCAEELLFHLDNAQLRFDSVRVALAT